MPPLRRLVEAVEGRHLLEQNGHEHGGNQRDDEIQHRFLEGMAQQLPDQITVDDEHGGKRANMQHEGEEHGALGHAEHALQQDEMPAAADGQKFAQSLNDAQQQGKPDGHNRITSKVFQTFLSYTDRKNYTIEKEPLRKAAPPHILADRGGGRGRNEKKER